MNRIRTIEWQVAGACNYDCTYCIQSKRYRRGRPQPAQIERALATFAALPDLVLALFGASTDPRCDMMLTTHRVYHSGVALTWSPVINQALAARRRADLRHTLLCRRRA